jgi:hypothetical protein
VADDLERLKAEAAARLKIAEDDLKAEEARQKIAEAKVAAASAGERARRADAKDEAETREKVATATSAWAKANLPGAPALKPLEGQVTEKDSGVLAEQVAYAMLGRAGEDMAKELGLSGNDVVLVVADRNVVDSDWAYRAITTEMNQLRAEVAAIKPLLSALEPPPVATAERPERGQEGRLLPDLSQVTFGVAAAPALPVLAALPAIVGAAADIAGYFASDYTLTGRTFQAKEDPLIAAAARAILSSGAKVVLDGFGTVPATSAVLQHFDDLGTATWGLQRARIQTEHRVVTAWKAEVERRKVRHTSSEEALAAAKGTTPPDTSAVASARRERDESLQDLRVAEVELAEATNAVEAAKALETRVDAFRAAATKPPVTTPPEKGGLPPLGAAAVRARLHEPSDTKITHLLHISIASSGGETQIRRSRFRSPIIRYVGVCTVTAFLADVEGNLVGAFTRPYAGQIRFKVSNDFGSEEDRGRLVPIDLQQSSVDGRRERAISPRPASAITQGATVGAVHDDASGGQRVDTSAT